jgi:hypothetical protein
MLTLTLGFLAVAVVVAPPLRACLASQHFVLTGAVLAARAALRVSVLERRRRTKRDEPVAVWSLAQAPLCAAVHVQLHL